MKALGAGTIHFDDFRKVDGVLLPFEQTVTLAEPALTQYPVADNFLHRLVLHDARFDTVTQEALVPDGDRPAPADRKLLAGS